MSDLQLAPELADQIVDLYGRMEQRYDEVARALDFSCTGCPDNCCDSFFLHHTYIEWAYLWQGFEALAAEKRVTILGRAAAYVTECENMLARGERPNIMCPLNENGLCTLYAHRLMICRLHGVPSTLTRPDGKQLRFPGCFRCQELVGEDREAPTVDRTDLFRELVELETAFAGHKRRILPKVKLTIAHMLVKGPPRI